MTKKGITTVNITRKVTTLIDKDGNVIDRREVNDDLKERQRRRAERLGLPFRE